jgi:hypothetical protein
MKNRNIPAQEFANCCIKKDIRALLGHKGVGHSQISLEILLDKMHRLKQLPFV